MGSSLAKTGYGCDQVALVSLWRRVWAASSATDPTAPFGICTLVKTSALQNHVRRCAAANTDTPAVTQAAGGSEGAGDHMAHMRWSQTGNMGALPNELMCVQPPWPAGVSSPLPLSADASG